MSTESEKIKALVEALEAMLNTWDAYLSNASRYPAYQKAKKALALAKERP